MLKNKNTILLILFIFAFILVLFILPNQSFAATTISNEKLEDIRNQEVPTNANIDDYPIIYNRVEESDIENGCRGNGVFIFWEPGEYVLEEDIELNGEILAFMTEEDSVVLNLNGHTINYVSELYVEYEKNEEEYYELFPAVYCKYEHLTVTGNGTINTNEDTVNYGAIKALGGALIENGTFDGCIYLGNFYYDENYGTDYVIKNGTFKETVYCAFPTTIENGTFDEVVFDQGGIINNGTFEIVSASSEDFYEYYSDDLEELIDEGYEMKLVINGGTYRYTGDSGFFTPINIRFVDTIINNATVINEGEYEIYSDCCWFEDDGNHSLTINGGEFTSPVGYAVIAIDPKNVTVTGGLFKGFYGGLAISLLDKTKIELSGGKYETTGADGERDFSRKVLGGIILGADIEDKLITNKIEDFTKLLKEGYTYLESPSVFYNSNDYTELVYTQRNIEIIRKIVLNSENEELKAQIEKMIVKLKKGEQVDGISDELALLILSAVEDGKEIKTEIIIKEISKEDIADDAILIEEIAGEKKIIKYFDIDIVISIDGAIVGNITELEDGIEITIPLDDELPKVKNGYTRTFNVIRIHNGKATELDAKKDGNNIKTTSDKYSTYAVTYEDVKNISNPKTGDRGVVVYILLFIISLAGFIYLKKRSHKLIK